MPQLSTALTKLGECFTFQPSMKVGLSSHISTITFLFPFGSSFQGGREVAFPCSFIHLFEVFSPHVFLRPATPHTAIQPFKATVETEVVAENIGTTEVTLHPFSQQAVSRLTSFFKR